eukprot:CAMPEP_0194027118 /NCGR_PEP_ID=MMETSP0009_2-20130614/1338_1 /TAXON_ID=210454 /ORGANISM="Grammatophora oceanica, Strain CCMP 410" /LENGTH=207 /DNA_ID=CAMNT_0038666077 /DNA_START=158 /DNA_END=784 /DNA_ORIENTATION=-
MFSSRFLLLCIFVGAAQANEQDDGSQSALRKRLFDPLSTNQADRVRRVKGQRSATTGLGRSLQVAGPSVTTFAVTNAMLNGPDNTGEESVMSLQVTALPTPELGAAPEIESSTKAPTTLLESSAGAPTTSPISSMPTPEIAAITTIATLNSQVSSPTPSPAPGPKGKKGKSDTTPVPVTMTMPGVSAVVAATSAGGAQAKKGKKRAR